MKKKNKKRKLNWKRVFKVLIILIIIIGIIYYLINLRIKRIIINGTTNIKDVEIIEKANIKDYPNIKDINLNNLENTIKNIALVNDVSSKINIWGHLIINIDEAMPLYYDLNNYLVLDNGKRIENNYSFLGLPTLVNEVPTKIEEEFISKLKKVDKNILLKVNEITYSPSISKDNIVIDDTRFIFNMNDGNMAYVNTLNLEKFNNYDKILDTTINTMGSKTKGVFHFDTATNRITFASFESLEEEMEVDEDGNKN